MESSGQIVVPPNTKDYPDKAVQNWVRQIVNTAEKYPKQRLVASWFVFEVKTLLGRTVKVFVDWETEKNYNDTLGNTVFVHINEAKYN